MSTTVTAESPVAAQTRPMPLPKGAILSLEQVAELLGKTLKHTRNLISVGLLNHQLIDGERCVWLSDLIAYKRDFDRDYAEWKADPLNRMWNAPFFHETFGMAEIPETR